MQDLFNLIRSAIRGAWRYRWTAMFVVWGVCLFGWTSVYTMPDVYEARARVFVDMESRLASVMGQVGAPSGVGSRVFVVRQAMLSRPVLEKVIEETGLGVNALTDEEKEEVFFSLVQNMSVETGRTREARNLYAISYRDDDREMAVSVVGALLNTFVEDVLNLKEQGSEVVTGYLDDQLEYYGTLLSDSEGRLADFKKDHVGLLPGESGGIFERLQTEMTLLEQLRRDLRREEDTRDELRRQLQTGSPYGGTNGQTAGGVSVISNPTESSIIDLEGRRNDLLLIYTERHPDVVALEEQLESLYAKREAEMEALREASGMEGAANSTNPVYQSVQIALNDGNVRIAGVRSDIAQRQAAVRLLESQVDTIPEVEAEYVQLTRDYAQYRELYNEIMVRKERERMGKVGEERDVVEFNIIDPPSAGLEPVLPKRTIMLVAVLIVGILAGGAIAFLMHLLNPVFYDVQTLHNLTGRPVLAAISMTWLERYRTRQRLGVASFSMAGMLLVAVFVVCIALQDFGVQLIQSITAQ